MKKQVIHFFLMIFLMICSAATLVAQSIVKGIVIDVETQEPLAGVSVTEQGTTNGVATGVDGCFELSASPGATLMFRYLGYTEERRKISTSSEIDLGTVALSFDVIGLADVTITSSIAIDRKTPVALSTISPQVIEERLGVKEFPEILKLTPGVHTQRGGGGFGDSYVNIRGFKTQNLAVMVNGVPMNDMENGRVYWSNWSGLADVTRSLQVQRGLGASKVSAPSIGGSINIVTQGVDAKKGGSASYTIGSNGYNKILFSVSTGLSETGWALTLLGGRTWGDGYVQGAKFEGYNYFLNIAKRFGDKHQLSFTAFGAPQLHNQRSEYDPLTVQEWQRVEQYTEPGQQYRFNPTFGYDQNGNERMANRNKYHKPQLSLNHMWQIDHKSSLSTAIYASIGDGWGYSGQGVGSSKNDWYGSSTSGQLNTKFRNPDGTFAYDKIQEMNQNSKNGSQMIMSVSKNLHRWFGLLSTYNRSLTENIDFYGGIDARYYKGIHTNEIIDLYGGDYYIDGSRGNVLPANNSAASGSSFKTKKLSVGDIVYRDYDGHIVEGGLFGQAEYTKDGLSAFLSASANNKTYWRYDRFYYDKNHAKSETINKIGFNVKGGANYNINKYHNVFANIGYMSRNPYFADGIFLEAITSHEINQDAVNEKAFMVELGYGFRSSFLNANLNLFHTKWNDRTLARSNSYETADGKKDRYTVNMQGLDATHQGIELDLIVKPFHWVELSGTFTLGNYRFDDKSTGYFYDSQGRPLNKDFGVASGVGAADHAKTTFVLDEVKVGGSAQTTATAGIKFIPTKDIHFGVDWFFYSRNYADWSPNKYDLEKIESETIYEQSWRIPDGNAFDIYASYAFHLGTLPATISGNVSNVFDQLYIESATDGSNHDWKTARVFYNLGREMSVRLKVNF